MRRAVIVAVATQIATMGGVGRAPSASTTSRHGIVWFIVIAVVLLVGVAGAAAMLVKRDKKRGLF